MGRADRAVLLLVARSAGPGAVVVAVSLTVLFSFGLTGSSAQNVVDVSQVRVIAENPAVRALYGQPLDVASPGAFIVWRYGQLVVVFSAIWAVLATTRALRGEEEAGRWDLLLSGSLGRRRLTALVLVGLMAAMATVATALLGTFLLAGEPLLGSVIFAAGFGLVLVTFVAVAAVASQVFAQGRRAAALAAATVGASFLVRMVADGTTGLGRLRWLTPFGWLEEVGPFADDRLFPLGLLVLTAVCAGAGAVALAGCRDVGDGLVRDTGSAHARRRLLRTPLGFAWRARLGGLIGWGAAVATLGLAVGAITGAFADFIATNDGFREIVADYGFAALVSAEGFVGTMAALTGVALALYGIVSIRAVWDDEASARLDLVYAAPVSRSHWLAGALAASAGALMVVAAIAIAATVAGIVVGGADISWQDTAAGLLNTLPVVALYFGLAVLLHGTAPGVASVLCGAAAGGGYLLALLGPALDWPAWVISISPFDHLAVVPAEPVDWAATVAMVVLAGMAIAGGFIGYARRDLR